MKLLLTDRPTGDGSQILADGVAWATIYPYTNKQGVMRWTAQTTKASPCGRQKAPPCETEAEARSWACAELGVCE